MVLLAARLRLDFLEHGTAAGAKSSRIALRSGPRQARIASSSAVLSLVALGAVGVSSRSTRVGRLHVHVLHRTLGAIGAQPAFRVDQALIVVDRDGRCSVGGRGGGHAAIQALLYLLLGVLLVAIV